MKSVHDLFYHLIAVDGARGMKIQTQLDSLEINCSVGNLPQNIEDSPNSIDLEVRFQTDIANVRDLKYR